MKRLGSFEAALLRGAGGFLAPGGRRGSLIILIYHRVLPGPDPLLPGEPDVERFSQEMDVLRDTCNVLPLEEAVERLSSASLPPRAACITFDDGYANNCTVAAPVLAAKRLPATIFVASAYIGGGRMFNDTIIEAVRRAPQEFDLRDLGLEQYHLADDTARRRTIDSILRATKYLDSSERLARARAIAERVAQLQGENLMLHESQLRSLRSYGITVGAHTETHPILTRLPAEVARREISASKSVLESIIGEPVTSFAYPNGEPSRDYDATHVQMVRQAGFRTAVSTAWGAASAASDRYQLPRMLPWDRSRLRFAARLLLTHRQQRAILADDPLHGAAIDIQGASRCS